MDDELTALQRAIIVAKGALLAPVLTWLVVTLAVLLFYVADAAAPSLGDATWGDAARFASGFFLTAFSGSVAVGGGYLSLAPLTLTLLAVGLTYGTLRRRGVLNWGEWAVATAVPVAFVGIVGAVSRPGGPWWVALVGASVWFGTIVALAGREFLVPEANTEAFDRIVHVVVLVVVGVLVVAVLAVGAGLIAGAERIGAIHSSFFGSALDTAGLTALQLAYVPDALVWGFAYLTGAGFAIGTGTSFSALGVTALPLPAIPAFGALPQVGFAAPWLVGVVVVVFALLGVYYGRHRRTDPLTVVLADAGAGAVLSALVISALVSAASGSLGSGRMATVGGNGGLIFGLTLAEVAIPFVLVSMLSHPTFTSWIRGRAQSASTHAKATISAMGENRERAKATADVEPAAGVAPEEHVESDVEVAAELRENPDATVSDAEESFLNVPSAAAKPQDTLDTQEIDIVRTQASNEEAEETK
ncbi:Tfp pilus assembly protein PilE [Arcanobacterium wilhelmae]|uniref:Tfp pilus assembly protein PilE n=1 Tax=Arcanobacterium wilhelmae TaxID=1803177 RepID=A0ABT9NCJ4_9ACTO|nr:DUF6350 family protein [Arcanobacterium wilhelmae]MDP9801444.1 Tfp pilus assembly protein PilE [Arcanobacterium wilhelmae]WFN90778.1 DUF6350 family protein [Arcanobacterium wilhelmae]